ncbi:GGDEF domain-containing protein [Azohydromonas aeria]|uniref:GGDEF domain-containing protein n=1 Tax=Azohydromonas aeria TaxID=2590212 RepID=UPI0012F8C344|nr:GGDEF domain-containing protein [Azohydromonas aeria]
MLLIDQLAEITGHRDRQHADALLLDTLQELLAPGSVALHRCLGDAPHRRWVTSTHRDNDTGQRRASDAASPCRCSPHPAPRSHPSWSECLRQLSPVKQPGEPGTLLLPLMVGAQGAGVVELRSDQPLPEYMQRTAEAVVRLYGNFLTLLDYGERDALTGVFNRKTFTDCFMRAVLQRPKEARHVYLAALDLDHFKHVNDTFGHLIGDEVLLLTARLMRCVLRTDDGLFRFGGEEFVVLLEDANEDGAHAALERLREQMAQYHFPQVGRVTMSIGFTAVQPGDLPPGALDRADRALYLAKASGRNQVAGPSVLAAAGMQASAPHGGGVDLF